MRLTMSVVPSGLGEKLRWHSGATLGCRETLLLGLWIAATTVPTLAGAEPPGGANCEAGTHAISFVNDCSYPVWLAELGNSTIECTQTSDCLPDSPGLQFCNVPVCEADADCPAISCMKSADCPVATQTCSPQGLCTPSCQAGSTCACESDAGCGGGGVCDTETGLCGGGLCQFSTVAPEAPADWEISAGGSAELCMPKGWGGRFWGRTDCTPMDGGLACVTGQCGPPYPAVGELECTKSGNPPMTLFEPTFDSLQAAGIIDFYDVSLVSGYNIPLEVAPATGSCVVTGSCKSDLNATCPTSLQVTGPACSEGKCPEGGVCVDDLCVVGCLDPCDACGLSQPPAQLNCAANMDLYCCAGSQTSNSCNSASVTCFADNDCKNLSNGALSGSCDLATKLCKVICTKDADCAGGTCDTDAGQCAPPLVSCATTSCAAATPPQPDPVCDAGLLGGVCVPTSDCCGPFNPDWSAAAKVAGGGGSETWTEFFKAACPTAYSYQFDDPTSSFTCADPGGGEQDYKVTFCPLPVPEPSRAKLAFAGLAALQLLALARRRLLVA